MKSLKKILSFMLALSMVFALVQIPSQAALKPSATKAKIKLVPVKSSKTTPTSLSDFSKATAEEMDLTAGSRIYIGVYAEGWDHIAEYTGENTGISLFTTEFQYDNTYVTSQASEAFVDSILVHDGTAYENDDGDMITPKIIHAQKNKYTYSRIVATKTDTSRYKFGLEWTGSGDGVGSDWVPADDSLITVLRFRLDTVPPAGTKIVSMSPDNGQYNFAYGLTGAGKAYQLAAGEDPTGDADPNDSSDLRHVLEFDLSGVDFFPAEAATQTGIKLKEGSTPTLSYKANQELTGVTLQTVMSDPTQNADIAPANVTYYYGNGTDEAIGTSAAKNLDGLTQIIETAQDPADNGVVKGANDKYLYAVAGDYMINLGKLTVTDSAVDEITAVSGKPADNSVYAGQTVDLSDVVTTVNKDNGRDGIQVTAGDLASNNMAIYKVTGTAPSKTYTPVTGETKWEKGDNTFVVAVKPTDPSAAPTIMSNEFTVVAAYDATNLSANSENAVKTKYNANDKFDPSGIKINAKKASAAANADPTALNYAAIQANDNIKIVIAADADAAKAATEATADTDITEAMITGGHKIYAVVDNDGTKSVLELGTIAQKAANTYSVKTDMAKKAYTYPETLNLTGLVIKAANADDPNVDTELNYDAAVTAGIIDTIKIDGTTVTTATPLTTDANGKKVEFYKGATKVAETKDSITVSAKTINYTPSTDAPSKTYDGDEDIKGATQVTATVNKSDLLVADVPAGVTGDTIAVTGLTFKYDGAGVQKATGAQDTDADDVKYKGKNIKVTGTPTIDGVTDFAKKYTIAPAQGVVTNGVLTNLKGIILPFTINITGISGITTIAKPDAAADVEETFTATADFTSDPVIPNAANLDVKVAGKAKFAANDVKTATAEGSDGVAVTINPADIVLSGDDAGNFVVGTVTGVKGKVSNQNLEDISVEFPDAKLRYEYPNLVPDLSDLIVKAKYSADDPGTTLTADKYTIKVGTAAFDPTAKLPYGDTKLTISYTENGVTKSKEITLTAKKKPIRLSDIEFSPSKVYGQDDSAATKTYDVPEGTWEGTDGAKVAIAYDVEYADSTSAGNNKSATIKNIRLVAKDGDADNTYDNYEIVDENGQPIAGTATTTVNDAVITNDTQETPAAPTVSIDPATNSIVISGPLGDDIEYSIDGRTWTKTPVFTDLTAGREYTVQARVAAKDNYNASEPSEARISTYRNHVRVFKKGADIATAAPLAEVYTDKTNAESDTDMNTNVFKSKPSRWKAYFTDAAATAKIEYPYQLQADTVLYMTQSSSGGGGGTNSGSSTYLVKFNPSTNGKIDEGGKTSVSVTSGASIASADVPTITANDGYKFVGWSTDGTEVVDPTSVKITKSTTFTAIYEEASEPTPTDEPTPTAEPTPTDKPSGSPVIDPNFMKPYASGYEDETFRPDNNITRAELAAMIARLSYQDDIPDGMYNASFPDVDADMWANKYIGYLENLDVLSGYEDGTFRPYDLVTRGEISSVIARAQRLDLIPYDGSFTDVTDSDWAKDYIQALVANGIASGYEDGTFGPYNPLTRAETVTMINNVLVPSVAIESFIPNDIESHWASGEILLAVNERQPK